MDMQTRPMSKGVEGQGSTPGAEGPGARWGWLQDPCEGLIYSVMKREDCSRRVALRKLQVEVPEQVELRDVRGGRAFRFNCTIWRRIEDGGTVPWIDEERSATAWRIGDDQGLLPEGRRGPIALPLETEVVPVDEAEYEYLGDRRGEDAEEDIHNTPVTLSRDGGPERTVGSAS